MSDTATDLQLRYLTDWILTATPIQRLLMLFDGLHTDLDAALEAFATRDWKDVSDHLVHAQEILLALRDGLDRTTPLGASLHGIYSFCLSELVRANLDKEPERLPAVRRLIEQIADANRVAAVANEPGGSASAQAAL